MISMNLVLDLFIAICNSSVYYIFEIGQTHVRFTRGPF